MTRQIKNFYFEGENFYGPASYMNERGNARLDRIISGNDELFNATAHYSPDIETAVCVWMQTDYAAYLGDKEAQSWMKA